MVLFCITLRISNSEHFYIYSGDDFDIKLNICVKDYRIASRNKGIWFYLNNENNMNENNLLEWTLNLHLENEGNNICLVASEVQNQTTVIITNFIKSISSNCI